ncbi:hypothetical protein [Azospirillum humicireducens]|uniref:hypothetical protein n=1 Tax=Azospirillum humicireducens TaxID=1226968 RepID=UPI00157F9C7A|nr:hypothetical protein [Azospirillum humicireducens]
MAHSAFTRGLRPFIDGLQWPVPGRSAKAKRKAALATVSDEILAAARASRGEP